jgi:hypothetical protein
MAPDRIRKEPVEPGPLGGVELVDLVHRHQLDLGPFGKPRRFVEYQATVPDSRSKRHRGSSIARHAPSDPLPQIVFPSSARIGGFPINPGERGNTGQRSRCPARVPLYEGWSSIAMSTTNRPAAKAGNAKVIVAFA